MKTKKTILLTGILLIGILFLTGCEKQNDINSEANSTKNIQNKVENMFQNNKDNTISNTTNKSESNAILSENNTVLLSSDKSINGTTTPLPTESSQKPSNIELMSYAQTVLDRNLDNPKYSRNENDYTFVNTFLRYKIGGKVTVNSKEEKFYLIIQFTDNTYTEYDVVSLQIGNNKIIK